MKWILSRQILGEAMYEALVRSTTYLPEDIVQSLTENKAKETDPVAQLHLETTLSNAALASLNSSIVCSDTGWTLFYVKIGDSVEIEGGYSELYQVAKETVAKASEDVKLRPTLVHPLTHKNPGNNLGPHFPKVELRFDPQIDYIEITAVPKGGGSEIYGSFFKMLVLADGIAGVKKFILDSVVKGAYAGKTCPPNIIGVGIGGTADVCMRLAKDASVLRPVGSRHPEPDIAQLEVELIEAINSLGIGPMGSAGKSCVLDVHVEYAMTHTAALAVGISTQCSLTRRCTIRVDKDGSKTFNAFPNWDYRG